MQKIAHLFTVNLGGLKLNIKLAFDILVYIGNYTQFQLEIKL